MTWLRWQDGGPGTCDIGKFVPMESGLESIGLADAPSPPARKDSLMNRTLAAGRLSHLFAAGAIAEAMQQRGIEAKPLPVDNELRHGPEPGTVLHQGKVWRPLDDAGLAKINAAKERRQRKGAKMAAAAEAGGFAASERSKTFARQGGASPPTPSK